MTNKNKTLELFNYINTPMSKESITVLYNANNITHEKCELYSDFIHSLILLVFDTYMGDDITSKEEQKNHFKWCWNKNIENFKKEGIGFASTKLYGYFLEFFIDVYYSASKKDENPNIRLNILKLWLYIFDYHNVKSKSDMDTLIEVYKLFNSAIRVI
jgi:hypothetical protein